MVAGINCVFDFLYEKLPANKNVIPTCCDWQQPV